MFEYEEEYDAESLFFESEEECQQYCDYLNNKSKEE